jgi:hypothetical protein
LVGTFSNRPRSILRREEKAFSTSFFPVFPLLLDASLFLTFHATPNLGCDWDGRASGGGDSGTGGCRNGGGPRYPCGEDGREKAILLATAYGEADEVAQRVSMLEDKLLATRRARGMAKEKILSLGPKRPQPISDGKRQRNSASA